MKELNSELLMKLSLNKKIIIFAFFGVLTGVLLSYYPVSILLNLFGTVGDLYIQLIRMVIIPLIFSSITVGIINLQMHGEGKKTWQLTMIYYISTVCIASLFGLIVVNIFQPGVNVDPISLQNSIPIEQTTFLEKNDFFTSFFSTLFMNPFAAMSQGLILQTIIFAIFFGVGLVALNEKAKTLSKVMEEFFNVMMKIISWVIALLPIGIFCLLAKLIATQNVSLLTSVGYFVIVVLGATFIHGFIILPSILWVFGRMHPLEFFRGISEAMLMAFSTSSSAVTIPVTLKCVIENLKVDRGIARFVVPLGGTVNMDGTALYEAIAAIYVANLYGIDLSFLEQCVVFFMAVVTSIGAPGIPSAGMVTTLLVLQAVGLPVEAVAILIPIDRLLDSFRTMVNVEGDAVGAVIVHNIINSKSK